MTIAAIDSGLMMALGALCLVVLSVAMLRRSQQRTSTGRDLTREHLARLRDQKHVRDSMDEVLVRLEQVARQINAQVDTRFVKLETVIRDADERIGQLRELLQDAACPTAERSSATNAAAAAKSLPKTRDERFRRIYDLADAGKPPIAIAESLQIPLGEVELILNLRNSE